MLPFYQGRLMFRRLLLILAAVPAWSAAAEPAQRTLAWDIAALNEVPKVHETAECPAPGMRAFFYEGLEFKARPTHVFAYYSAPQRKPPEGGWPAIVCAHGGGGTAYPDWVRKWNGHGYAAISMDLEGHLPDHRPHENAGPSRVDWFGDRDLPDKEQWFYHAVADVIRAHSRAAVLSRDQPRQDRSHGHFLGWDDCLHRRGRRSSMGLCDPGLWLRLHP